MLDAFHRIVGRRSRGLHGNKITAVVVNKKDPLGLGRIQARARDIHDGIPDDQLVWSAPNEGFGAGTAGQGKRDFIEIGQKVFLSFLDNSPYHPVYEHGPATKDKKIPDLDEFSKGFVDRAGNLVKTFFGENGDKNIKTDTHQTGTGSTIDTDGNHAIDSVKDFVHQVFGAKAEMKGDTNTVMTLNFKHLKILADVLELPPNVIKGGSYQNNVKKPEARQKPQYNKPSGTKY